MHILRSRLRNFTKIALQISEISSSERVDATVSIGLSLCSVTDIKLSSRIYWELAIMNDFIKYDTRKKYK